MVLSNKFKQSNTSKKSENSCFDKKKYYNVTVLTKV
jgi:hypothetical protein